MAEGYQGVKFQVIMLGHDAPQHLLLPELKKWCGVFHEKGLAPPYPGGSYGNLSFRIKTGDDAFIITGTCMGLKGCLDDDKFVLVTSCDLQHAKVFAYGTRQPSSESMMHYSLYKARPDIHAIFHGHSPEILDNAERLNILTTPEEYPYGTPELALALENCALKSDFFIAKNHGFVALGVDMPTAGTLALERLQQSEK